MPDRVFPLSPRSTRDLEVGDYWVVPLSDGSFGACLVTDLKRSGPGALSSMVVGVVDWRGDAEPAAADLAGRRVLAQGLTRVEVFTEGGAQILGNSQATLRGQDLRSAFRDFEVGTKTQTWGWKVLARRVADTLAST